MKFNTKTVRLFTDKHLENFGSIFETLYKDELLTDCTLCCKEGSIQVHKLILAASSPYFRNFFLQHGREKAIFFMYGISFAQLKNFIELIYKGSINVPPDNFTALYDLAEELQVTGLLVDGLPTSTPASDAKFNGCGVDTRFKGQKRVVVDFNAENESSAAKIAKGADILSTSSEKSSNNREDIDNSELKDSETSENTSESSDDANTNQDRDEGVKITTGVTNTTSEDKSNLSAWARKERKFKCELCPSSFKRASHLSRHQLVHTGERPYACHQCDKAFSRHDKLKHHIHKAHELQSLNECLPEDSLYTIGHIQFLPPEQSMFESPAAFIPPEEPEDKVELSKVSQDEPDSAPIKKKARGRPRKYPIVPPPVGKRPRGRPRLKPFVPPPLVKRPRGRPRLNPIAASQPSRDTQSREIYDITNMPYGDLQYLTKPTEDKEDNINDISSEERQIMEPLVEINMDLQEKSLSTKDEKRNTTFLKNIGLFEKAIASSQTSQENQSKECYDITNMPYGDFQYLTKPVEDGEDAINEISLDEPQIMEPLVEIKMEPQEKSPIMKDDKRNTSFLENIGLFEKAIGKIGECTISVASNSNNDNNPSN